MVDDNYHFTDETERYEVGVFATAEEAIAASKAIVDEFLNKAYKPGITAEELEKGYKHFGEDPFISTMDKADEPAMFSAWEYAKERSEYLAANGIDPK
jgi:uncharacterized protein YktA (UPF0223 family)